MKRRPARIEKHPVAQSLNRKVASWIYGPSAIAIDQNGKPILSSVDPQTGNRMTDPSYDDDEQTKFPPNSIRKIMHDAATPPTATPQQFDLLDTTELNKQWSDKCGQVWKRISEEFSRPNSSATPNGSNPHGASGEIDELIRGSAIHHFVNPSPSGAD
jgi:hypothetical protein